jgi:hypothetical protein
MHRDIKVLNVTDQVDGSLIVEFEMSESAYKYLKESGEVDFSKQESINQLVNNSVDAYIQAHKQKETPDGI